MQRSSTPLSTHADAYAHGVRLLASQPRSTAQLRAALERREAPAEIIESVIADLHGVGALDDAAFAHAWVTSRRRTRQYSATRLAYELQERGVAEEHIDAALAALADEHFDENTAEEAAARTLAEKKLRQLRGVGKQTQIRRILGALTRAGYSHTLATRITLSLLESEAAE